MFIKPPEARFQKRLEAIDGQVKLRESVTEELSALSDFEARKTSLIEKLDNVRDKISAETYKNARKWFEGMTPTENVDEHVGLVLQYIRSIKSELDTGQKEKPSDK